MKTLPAVHRCIRAVPGVLTLLAALLLTGPTVVRAQTLAPADEAVVVARLSGRVEVRRGVDESWSLAVPGLRLRPEDSIRTGPDSRADLVAPDGPLSLPPGAMLDVNDLRQVGREELLLSLTMDDIRALPAVPKPRPGAEPSVRVLHGSDLSADAARVTLDEAVALSVGSTRQRVEGARALYDQAYYGSSALVLRRTMRSSTDLRGAFEVRLLVARSFEQLDLPGEALAEYQAISRLPGLDPTRARLVGAKIEALQR